MLEKDLTYNLPSCFPLYAESTTTSSILPLDVHPLINFFSTARVHEATMSLVFVSSTINVKYVPGQRVMSSNLAATVNMK